MKLIKLDENTWINPELVATVEPVMSGSYIETGLGYKTHIGINGGIINVSYTIEEVLGLLDND